MENTNSHCLSLEYITSKQRLKIKSSVTDANNHFNGIFPSFNTLSPEISPGSRIIDIFHSCFSFFYANHESKESKNTHIYKFDEYIIHTLTDPKTVIIISDVNIKNNTTTPILHIYLLSNPTKKTLHYTVNVTNTEAELFVIRCRINQTVQILGVAHIIVIMNVIHAVHHIFDSLNHPYQLHIRNAKIRLYLIFLFFSIFRTRVRSQWDVTGHCHTVT